MRARRNAAAACATIMSVGESSGTASSAPAASAATTSRHPTQQMPTVGQRRLARRTMSTPATSSDVASTTQRSMNSLGVDGLASKSAKRTTSASPGGKADVSVEYIASLALTMSMVSGMESSDVMSREGG